MGPLRDLTTRPSATNPVPLFISPVDVPPETVVTHSAYPALRWHKDSGQEITVYDAQDDAVRAPKTKWTAQPPTQTALSPEELARQMFEALSPEDQQFVIIAQREAKLARVNEAMSALPPHQIDALTAKPAPAGKRA